MKSISENSEYDGNERIRRFSSFSYVFLFLGIVSSVVIFIAYGTLESEGAYTGVGWEFHLGGFAYSLMCLFLSFFIFYGCELLIYIAEHVTAREEDKL